MLVAAKRRKKRKNNDIDQCSPRREEPVAPFKNATSREFRIPPPAGAGGVQFAGIDRAGKLEGMK
jgi:hypothetical protein